MPFGGGTISITLISQALHHGVEPEAMFDEAVRVTRSRPIILESVYRDGAELSFKWAKPPASIAPIFLETPARIAALGCVYLLALLVYTLVERQVRKSLVARGETLPDRTAASQRPTARTVFQLMRNIAVVSLWWAGRTYRQVTARNAHQLHVIQLQGCERSIYTLPPRHSG